MFTNLMSHWDCPILSIFTPRQIVFLDQRKLQLITYSLSQADGESQKALIAEQQLYSLTDAMFSKNGTELFCFYDTQELYTFKFHDGYSLDQIESICHRDNSYPINGKLVKHGQQILPLNQTGFSSDVPTKEWSTSSTSLMKNVGPIVDIQQIRETMYFVSGSAPSSALYQAKKGLTIESDIQDHIQGSIEFDRRIDKLWIFCDLALIQFLEGDQELFQFDGGNVTEITAPPIDMDRETLAIMADVTSNGWKLIFQLV